MTREEAIKELREASDSEVRYGDIRRHYNEVKKRIEAFELAIKALEKESSGDAISRDEVIDILLNEMECVQRASDKECNRDCAKCDLLRDTNKILQAYRISIKALEHPEENVVAIMPCDDCISRQIISDYVGSHIQEINTGYGDLNKHTNEILRMIVDYIESIPSVTPQQRWIPVSERLPEIHQVVLLSLRSLDIEVRFRAETEPYFYCHGVDGCYVEPQNVLAWMPLPEPYRAESE